MHRRTIYETITCNYCWFFYPSTISSIRPSVDRSLHTLRPSLSRSLSLSLILFFSFFTLSLYRQRNVHCARPRRRRPRAYCVSEARTTTK